MNRFAQRLSCGLGGASAIALTHLHEGRPPTFVGMLRTASIAARGQPELLRVAVPRRPIQQPRGYAADEVIAHDAHPLQVRQVAQRRRYLTRQPVVPQPQVGQVRQPTQIGQHPTRQFVLCRYRCSRADRSPKLLGIGPLRSLSLRSSHVSSGSGVCGFASLAEFAPKSATFGVLGRFQPLPQARRGGWTGGQMAEFAYELCHTKRRVNADELARIT